MKCYYFFVALFCMTVVYACGDNIVVDEEESIGLTDYNIYLNKMSSCPSDYKPLVLCHFSDIHGSRENCERILRFTNKYAHYLDDVICTGDLVAYSYTDDFSYWSDVSADSVIFCIGNHDSANSSYDWTANSAECCFERFYSSYIENWEVIQPEDGLNEKCYFYKDYPQSRIRLIFIDSMHFDSMQILWLKSLLNDCLINELSVICACHFHPGNIKHYDINFHMGNDDYVVERDCSLNSLILDYGDSATPVIDDFIKHGGKFITWLFGHTHRDLFGVAQNTNQLCIGVAEALWRDGYTGYYGDNVREYGTKSQDLFNIISINVKEKTIRLLRIGADETTDGKKRFKMCWDYEHNKEVDW